MVNAELDGKKIRVTWDDSHDFGITLNKVRSIPGRRFVGPEKGGPYNTVPLDLITARALRATFGADLRIGPELKAWGRREVEREKQLLSLTEADDAELVRLPEVLPKLYATLRPSQRAGISFAAKSRNPLIADHPGLGKTLEAIGAIFEAGTDYGPNLVIAPLTSLETVWLAELSKWQEYPVFIPMGSHNQRMDIIYQFINSPGPGWLICNPQMFTLEKRMAEKRGEVVEELVPKFKPLHRIKWANIIVDECHKNAIRNRNTATAKGIYSLDLRPDGKRMAMSGTPMGGKAINLWGILHYLNPDVFTSKWNWAHQWLEVRNNGFGEVIGDIKRCWKHHDEDVRPRGCEACEAIEADFYKALLPYMIRRTKAEVAPELPPKQEIDIWCDMTPAQEKQYEGFASDAEIRIDEQKLSATSILAEYTRLKQFADAKQKVTTNDEGEILVTPTTDSGKLLQIERLLDERGIFDPPEERERNEQVVIFSQFSQIVDMVAEWLEKKGVVVDRITGATNKKGQRTATQRAFQAGEIQVLCMTTTAGGVAITLDNADTVIFIDETWTPDDQEQASDRVHRLSRIHQVTVYYLRSKGTIEETIMNTNLDKADINRALLDARRAGFRALQKKG